MFHLYQINTKDILKNTRFIFTDYYIEKDREICMSKYTKGFSALSEHEISRELISSSTTISPLVSSLVDLYWPLSEDELLALHQTKKRKLPTKKLLTSYHAGEYFYVKHKKKFTTAKSYLLKYLSTDTSRVNSEENIDEVRVLLTELAETLTEEYSSSEDVRLFA